MRAEHYPPESRDSTPRFLVARVTPALSRSCRLAVDLPVLGVLTWLCGGARSPRRGVPTTDLWRRARQMFPALRRRSERELGGALRRIWRAGLATVDEHQRWRPCWSRDAMVCRVDVAFWRRDDVSAAAKRVDAVAGHRIARGRSDAAEWLGAQCGMQRGRICAALRELENVGRVVRTGLRSSARGCWSTWSTGTEAQGVPKTQPCTSAHRHTGAASPMTRAAAVPDRTAAARAVASTRVLESSAGPVTAAWLLSIGVGAPLRRLTARGAAGLDRHRERLAARLRMQGLGRGVVAAWLLRTRRDGLPLARSLAALAAAIAARGSDLSAFVKRRGAEALLRPGPRLDAGAAVAAGVANHLAREQRRIGATEKPLDVCDGSTQNARRMTLLRRELARLESAWRAAPGSARQQHRARHHQARTWLLGQLASDPSTPPSTPLLAPSCSRSATSLVRTSGSR